MRKRHSSGYKAVPFISGKQFYLICCNTVLQICPYLVRGLFQWSGTLFPLNDFERYGSTTERMAFRHCRNQVSPDEIPDQARKGTYSQFEVQRMPIQYLMKYFTQVGES